MLRIHVKGVQSTTEFAAKMTPWDLYLIWRFSKDGMISAKIKVNIGHLRETFIDVSELDEVATFTPESLDHFETNYAERGIMVW